MTHGPTQIEYRQFSAPVEDRAALVEPRWEDVGRLLDANIRQSRQYDYDVQGRSLASLSAQARAELLAEARRWTVAYRDVRSADGPDERIVLAGHQPELFHPGVWFKNFALGAVARRYGATAVNLVIDSDTIKSAALTTPVGAASDPRLEAIAFDEPGLPVPYEERAILDRRRFADFGRSVAQRIGSLVADPMIREYWPWVLQRAAQTDRLGYCLAQARHQWEGRRGLDTLEIPQSRVCECPSFRWFVVHLVARLPEFRDIYNEAVREYRRVHRIRSVAHPVPDLAVDGPWIESPLWIWTAEDPRRRRLFVSASPREVTLSDRQGLEIRLPVGADGDGRKAVECLDQWSHRGVKLRSRALITTLWARLALGDLFLHGIGGAKYDQVTDRLIERFFGLTPPGIMVLSATLHLPIKYSHATLDEARAGERELRQLTFHPERFIETAGGEPRGASGGECRRLLPRRRPTRCARWMHSHRRTHRSKN